VLDPPDSFQPLFRSGDWQTIIARYWTADLDSRKYPAEVRIFETEPGVKVLTHCHAQTRGGAGATVLIVHGLEGSSRSPYVLRMSCLALAAGYDVVRLNIRNCGDTEHLGPTLYHSGLTTDLRAVAEQLSVPLYIVGFSMGGNMALKLGGEWSHSYPPNVRAICAVSPPIDLAMCALRIAERRNRIYEVRFLRRLRRTLARKKSCMSVGYSLDSFAHIRSLIDFDNAYTAPAFGYSDAFDYYAKASSIGFLKDIALPVLVVHAQDDPFIPFEMFSHAAFRENPNLTLLAPRHGGHVAFVSRRPPRFWAEEQVLRFFNWAKADLCLRT
jgi:predicted alpha/beta-fold hydrolase